MIADSGSTTNVIDLNTFRHIKIKSGKNIPLHPSSTSIKAYGSNSSLPIAGYFSAKTDYEDQTHLLNFYVIDQDKAGNLLSKKTLLDLGIISFNINTIKASDEYSDLWEQYPNITNGVGKLKDFQVHLHIDKTIPPVEQSVRRVPYHLRKQLEQEIKYLEDNDIIERVTHPTSWISPVHLVSKDNKLRLTLDMRQANGAVKRVKHPIPTTEEVFHTLNGAKFFSKLDLNKGYHQLELDEQSRDITTFTCHLGLFRYKRLIFGINSALEEFQHTLSRVLSHCKGCHNISDDIIVFGASKEEHDRNLKEVFKTLEEAGLTLNKAKCDIGVTEITYFGYRINNDGIQPIHQKCQAINNLQRPTNPTEVRSFLGMTNMMARFIDRYADLIEPLTRLTKKGVNWTWGMEQQDSFETLLKEITSNKILAHFDHTKELELYTDASPVGISAILIQEKKPITFISRLLSDVERRYCQTEREALAIIWACERLHTYLYGTTFILHTDHQSLTTLYGRKGNPSARILRWALRMQPYCYTVNYSPGPINPADYTSRHPSQVTDTGKVLKPHITSGDEMHINSIIAHSLPCGLSLQEIVKESLNDSEIQSVVNALKNNSWNTFNGPPAYKYQQQQLTHKNSLLLRDNQIVIPNTLRTQVLKLAHIGHLGINKTKNLMRSKVWWPGMDRDVSNLIKTCIPCQSSTYEGAEKSEPLRMTEVPTTPFSTLHIDLCGPFPSGDSVVSLIDETSKWPVASIMKSTTTKQITEFLDEAFQIFGFPDEIVSDNGPQFKFEFDNYCARNGIRHRKVTPYHPRANGAIERFFRCVKKTIWCAVNENQDWKQAFKAFIFQYRNTPHSSTGLSPSEIMLSFTPRTYVPSIKQFTHPKHRRTTNIAISHDKAAKDIQKAYADKKNHAKMSNIAVGDVVLLKRKQQNKFQSPYDPEPFVVSRRNGNSVTIEKPGCVRLRNISQLKIIGKSHITKPTDPTPISQPDKIQTQVPTAVLPGNFVFIQPCPVQTQNQQVEDENSTDPTPTSSDITNRPTIQTDYPILIPQHPIIKVTRQAVHDPNVWNRCINPNPRLKQLRERRNVMRYDPNKY